MQDRDLAALLLVRREAEIQALNDLLDGIDERGAALLLRGEAGIGKSSLLATPAPRHAPKARSP